MHICKVRKIAFLFPGEVKCLVEEEIPDTVVGETEAEDENLECHAVKVGNRGRTQRQGICSQKMSTWPCR